MKKAASAFAMSAALLCASAATATPPPGADPAMHQWFESLKVPDTDLGCCSEADCRRTEARKTSDGHWEVLISKQTYGASAPDDYEPVPDRAILKDKDNPYVQAVACWYGDVVRCFLPPGPGL